MRFFLAATALLSVLCATACSGNTTDPVTETTQPAQPTQAVQEATAETAAPTEAVPKSPAERVQGADTAQQIFDECGVLADVQALEEYAAAFAVQYDIYAAVVITEQLGGMSPDAFAAEYYNALYGADSTGFLVLINNDTNEDRVHTSGTCAQYLTQQETALAIAQATPLLVEGEYDAAAKRLLQLGECMQHAPATTETTEET